jgi:hypothetical protein
MWSRWAAYVVLGLGVVLTRGEVRAEPRDPSAAEALFRAGREAFEQRDYATALGRFDEAYRLDPTLGALLNRAICEDELGQLTRAWEDYRKVLERLSAGDPRVEIASLRLRAVEKRLAWVTIKLEKAAPRATTVTRRNVALGAASLGVALPLDPGRHEFVASAPGHRSRTYVLDVLEGERRELLVGLVALPPGSQPRAGAGVKGTSSEAHRAVADWTAPAPRVDGSSNRPTVGYVLLGAGGVALSVAAVSGVLLLDRVNTVKAHCNANKQCDEIGEEAGRSGRTFRAVAAISLAAGAVSAGIGGYLLLSSKGESTEVAWRGTF